MQSSTEKMCDILGTLIEVFWTYRGVTTFPALERWTIQNQRRVQKYTSSTMLSAEMPKNKPSKPPQIATKSEKVYNSIRFIASTWSLKLIDNSVCWILKWVKEFKTKNVPFLFDSVFTLIWCRWLYLQQSYWIWLDQFLLCIRLWCKRASNHMNYSRIQHGRGETEVCFVCSIWVDLYHKFVYSSFLQINK